MNVIEHRVNMLSEHRMNVIEHRVNMLTEHRMNIIEHTKKKIMFRLSLREKLQVGKL